LIGGPNQSHKVNFKELPDEGKISSKVFLSTPVNYFSNYFQKCAERVIFCRPVLFVAANFAGPFAAGRAENARWGFQFKTFL
jgi:hypothetical protein